MMREILLDREEELKLLGFLASLAGLLGIVVSVSGLEVGPGSSTEVRAYFSVFLVVFLFISAITYLSALAGRDIRQYNMAVLGYFSGLLGFVVGLAAATLYPPDIKFAGFWATGILLGVLFYLSLSRLHRNLKWTMEPVRSAT